MRPANAMASSLAAATTIIVVIGWCAAASLASAGDRGAAIPRLPCKSPGRLVAATSDAVLTLSNGAEAMRYVGYYACSRGHRARSLGFDVGSQQWGGIKRAPSLAGRFVAYGTQTCDKVGCDGAVASVALDSGALAGKALAGADVRTIVSVQVTSKGIVFWTAKLNDGSGAEVYRLDRHKNQTLLDSGAVDPESLVIAGSRAYWMKHGQPVTAS